MGELRGGRKTCYSYSTCCNCDKVQLRNVVVRRTRAGLQCKDAFDRFAELNNGVVVYHKKNHLCEALVEIPAPCKHYDIQLIRLDME